MMRTQTFVLRVWGDYACFSRPELKVERFSYPLPPPSAVRGIFDAIYSKPTKFRWQPEKVEVLTEPSYLALRRNEVKEKISTREAERWAEGKEEPKPILADASRELSGTDQKGRTQRQTMALRNVDYRLHASIRPWPGFEDQLTALEAQFVRRASSGKCFQQPYLGCREFAAFFELCVAESGPPPKNWNADDDLGLMVYDVFDLSRPGKADDQAHISLFRPKVSRGIMTVPAYEDLAVIKLVGRVC